MLKEGLDKFTETTTVLETTTTAGLPLRDDLLSTYPKRSFGATNYWMDLLKEGQNLKQENPTLDKYFENVLEVGGNRAHDAVKMAKMGFRAHSFEPSPLSFQRMKEALQSNFRREAAEKVFIYNYAVGDKDGGTVSFMSSDSTGAHVVSEENAEDMDVVPVPTTSIDKFLEGSVAPDFTMHDYTGNPNRKKYPVAIQKQGTVYAAKVDVQGFEPFVFRGMKNAIQERRIPYIMTEWWPRGIETGGNPNRKVDVDDKCQLAMEMMYALHDAGYALFAAPLEAHPGITDPDGKNYIKFNKMDRRFDDLREDCLAIYALEEKFPNFKDDFNLGYWTDIFAVSPDAPLPKTPETKFGKSIQNYLSTVRNTWDMDSYTYAKKF